MDFTDDHANETTAEYIKRLITERNDALRKLEQIRQALGQ